MGKDAHFITRVSHYAFSKRNGFHCRWTLPGFFLVYFLLHKCINLELSHPWRCSFWCEWHWLFLPLHQFIPGAFKKGEWMQLSIHSYFLVGFNFLPCQTIHFLPPIMLEGMILAFPLVAMECHFVLTWHQYGVKLFHGLSLYATFTNTTVINLPRS